MIPQAANAIETLINLAQQGEIDPWDVQVIEVVDRFLNELESTKDNHSDKVFQQTNLPKSGQAFLWASMLVRFKADTLDKLHLPSNIQENLDENDDIEAEEDIIRDHLLQPDLEKHLRRRNAALPTYKRRVNLQELINYIQKFAEELETSKPSKRNKKSPRAYSQREATRMVVELAHQENLTELAKQLEIFLQEKYSQCIQTHKKINIEDLLSQWHGSSKTDDKQKVKTQDKVGIFWALLLLSSQSKVQLFQEELYQNLYIQVL